MAKSAGWLAHKKKQQKKQNKLIRKASGAAKMLAEWHTKKKLIRIVSDWAKILAGFTHKTG